MPHHISVSVRLRPLQPGSEPARISADARGVVTEQKVFEAVENVVTGSDQEQAYQAIAYPLLARLRDGYSCTLLAYGQTGSGKTHTMFGPPGCLTEASLTESAGAIPPTWGIFPRIALELLQRGGGTLHASAIEVYQDGAFDLLADRAPLQVGTKSVGRQVGGGGCVIPGLEGGKAGVSGIAHAGVHPAHCQCGKCFKAQEAEKAAREAKRHALANAPREVLKRSATALLASSSSSQQLEPSTFATVGEKLLPITTPVEVAQLALTIELTRTAVGHALNARSSRSHCLVHLYCVERQQGRVTKKQLLFVDLAGSERILKSGVEGVAATQAMAINGSLTALGKVIRALGANAKHVSFRDSTLTKLLRSSLDGHATTSVVINVASEPQHYEETLCSLEFGERMAGVKTVSTKVTGQRSLGEAEIHALIQELKALRTEIAEMESADLDIGDFHPDAVPSEVKSLKLNFRRQAQLAARAKALRTELAESKGRGDENVSALNEKVAQTEREASKQLDLLEMQKTAPAVRGGPPMWLGPNKIYVFKVARVQQIEDALAMC
eukprot:TRINITY_DN73549_c0_g1_i1.p1 TRINITY_DN73549_c0_g1~~TRINITY_DN73549_c0_g1_i1.p1  ORF type:complete len:554 (+),score=74.30 TRINITY_DN73549_c0_g1_i1:236-1897(+)